MDSVPLFEREHRKDSQLVQGLQNELADAKRFIEAQARRQNDLEYVNEDLERRCDPAMLSTVWRVSYGCCSPWAWWVLLVHRLEQEALDRIALDAQKADDER